LIRPLAAAAINNASVLLLLKGVQTPERCPAHPNCVIILRMFTVKDDEAIAVDRELEASGQSIRCPLCGWLPAKALPTP